MTASLEGLNGLSKHCKHLPRQQTHVVLFSFVFCALL